MIPARHMRLVLACLALGACLDTGTERLSIPLSAHGEAATPVAARNDFEVELSRADIAFGPLYLCAGEVAGELCEVARAEWLDSAVIDALDPNTRELGELEALQGEVRSMMYDVGLGFEYTDRSPQPTAAAEMLEGVSVVVEGTARRDGIELPFVARARIAAQTPGRSALTAQVPTHALLRGDALSLGFDAAPWVRDMDFEALLDGDGAPPAALPVQVPERSQPHRALVSALSAQWRPTVRWE